MPLVSFQQQLWHSLAPLYIEVGEQTIMILLITYDTGSYVIVSGTSIIWTAQGSFVSTILFLNTALADLMMKGTILVALLGFTILGNSILILITVSITIHDLILLTSKRLEPSLLYVLGQKGGIQQEDRDSSLLQVQSNDNDKEMKAMTATLILNSKDINFDEFEMRCSLIDTGTDAVLRTDECNTDQSSVQDTKASITTAGGQVLKTKSKGTLTTYVTDEEFNV